MKICQIWGDMAADRVDDQYPTVAVCEDCVTAHTKGEDAMIVAVVGDYDEAYGEECYFCGITKDEEDGKEAAD